MSMFTGAWYSLRRVISRFVHEQLIFISRIFRGRNTTMLLVLANYVVMTLYGGGGDDDDYSGIRDDYDDRCHCCEAIYWRAYGVEEEHPSI